MFFNPTVFKLGIVSLVLTVASIGVIRLKEAKSLDAQRQIAPQPTPTATTEPPVISPLSPLTDSAPPPRVLVAPLPDLKLPPLPTPEADPGLQLPSEAEIAETHDRLMQGILPPEETAVELVPDPIPAILAPDAAPPLEPSLSTATATEPEDSSSAANSALPNSLPENIEDATPAAQTSETSPSPLPVESLDPQSSVPEREALVPQPFNDQ